MKANCLKSLGDTTLQKHAKPSDPRMYLEFRRVSLFCRNYISQNASKQDLGKRAGCCRKGLWKAGIPSGESAFHLPRAGECWRPPLAQTRQGPVSDQSPSQLPGRSEKRRIRTQRLLPARARGNLNTVEERLAPAERGRRL